MLCLPDAVYVCKCFQSPYRLIEVPEKIRPALGHFAASLATAVLTTCLQAYVDAHLQQTSLFAVHNAHAAALIRLASTCMLTFRQVQATVLSKHKC